MKANTPFKFTIHEDIRKAWTLPARFYADPAVHEASKSKIFARSWQFVADMEVVKVPGQLHPFILLEGCLDEPLLLVRDMKDTARCLSNVCTHRGNLVIESPGNERFLRCRYHGRRFGLDGKMQHMPEFEGVEGFPCEKDDLPSVPLGEWGPLLFVSLDPFCSLEEILAPMKQRLGWLPLNEFKFEPSLSRDYLIKANWALYCDNYLEGFHIPFIHAGLNETLDYGNYRTELFRWCNLQLGIAKEGEECFELPSTSQDYGERVGAYYYWLYPNMMFNFYPWGLSINVVKPLSHAVTRVSFLSYVWRADRIGGGAGAELDRVEREDEVVVEATQRGIQSRFYDRGRYSPLRERGTHHFHRLLAESLGGEGADG